MNRDTLPGRSAWLSSSLLLLCLGAALASSLNWRKAVGGASAERESITEQLMETLHAQRRYYTNNQSYAASFYGLGLGPSGKGPWQFQMLTARVDQKHIVLVEAEGVDERLMVDLSGTRHRSPLRHLISLPPLVFEKERKEPAAASELSRSVLPLAEVIEAKELEKGGAAELAPSDAPP